MIYQMKLKSKPFYSIKARQKTIELRLYDEKRQQLRIGDTIEFTCLDHDEPPLFAKITALYRFDNFADLYAKLPLEKCGYTSEEVQGGKALPSDMEEYYSLEEQQQYGVVGIEIELLSATGDSTPLANMKISVMSRYDAIRHCYYQHERPTAIISISDPYMSYTSEPFVSEAANIIDVLRLSFSDADRPMTADVYGRMTTESDLMKDEDAEAVVKFVRRHSDADLIVHCDAGISRSAGVAGAIMKYIGDDSPVFDSGYHRPNMWCYRKTLEAFHKNFEENS